MIAQEMTGLWNASAVTARTAENMRRWVAALVRKPGRARVGTPPHPSIGWLLFGFVLMIALVGTTMSLADARLIEFARTTPPAVKWLFGYITNAGKSGWFLWPLGLFVILAAACSTPAIGRFTNGVLVSIAVRAAFLFLAIGVPGLLVTVGKRLIGRVRPSALGPFAYEPFSWKAAYASFPSGHATTAFAAAVAVSLVWPRARWAIWLYAFLVAASRILVNAHFPSDVLAGAAVGALGAILVRNWFAARGLAFTVTPDGPIKAWPGPSLRRVKGVAQRLIGH